jgi:hypothetical protein
VADQRMIGKIGRGKRVVVVEYFPPRTIVVTPM